MDAKTDFGPGPQVSLLEIPGFICSDENIMPIVKLRILKQSELYEWQKEMEKHY